jgi:hypothetical protein
LADPSTYPGGLAQGFGGGGDQCFPFVAWYCDLSSAGKERDHFPGGLLAVAQGTCILALCIPLADRSYAKELMSRVRELEDQLAALKLKKN